MKSHAPTARAAASISSAVASGRPNAMLSRDRPAEQERLLRDDPHLRAQRLARAPRAGRGRRRARGRRSGRRSARRAWRTSTCPRRWRRRARPSGRAGRRSSTSLERVLRRLVVAVAVGERDVLEADLAADARRSIASGASVSVGLARRAARRSCRAPPCRTGRSCRPARAGAIGSKKPFSAAMKPTSTPTVMSPSITW